MSERKLFGTDGIRGRANAEPMTPELALRLGRAITLVSRRGKTRAPRIVIGKDTRLSGYMLETALAAGICAMGGRVMLSGPIPTPAIANLTQSMRADAGVVISASHNPFADNGIKIFGPDGFKLPDSEEMAIEALLANSRLDTQGKTGAGIGRAERFDHAIGRYIVYAKSTFPKELSLDGLKVVVDAAHGAAYRVAPAVFAELGAEVIQLGCRPNGVNINRNCGALHPEHVAHEVKRQGAQLGVALDGDADRVIFVDEKAQIVDGDAIMALCATRMLKRKRLQKQTLVTTIMSNMGLDRALEAAGGKIKRTNVGDRYVVEEMRRGGYNFGGEQSGHLIFLDHATTGDGTVAALQVIAIMLQESRPLSELSQVMKRVPQVLESVKLPARRPLSEMLELGKRIVLAEKKLGKNGRVVVRWSGTEAKLRLMVEGPDPATLKTMVAEMTEAAKKDLGKGRLSLGQGSVQPSSQDRPKNVGLARTVRAVWLRRALLVVIALSALWHADWYDFFCDDAFIALRYAQNLIEHHELAYNLGQRVEGFTSPLWVLLISVVGSFGVPLVSATRALAAAAGLLTFWALSRFWDELNPRAPWLVLAPALALAMSAPFAAWTFGGLETPLFVATFTLALATIGRDARKRDVQSSLLAGLSVACCVLCRPEGATLIAIGSVVVCLRSPAAAEPRWRRLLAWLSPIVLLVGGYQLFRLRYYGYPLPNTFYVKTSGAGLWERGVSYLGFAGGEFGWALVGACLLSLLFLLIQSSLLRSRYWTHSGRVLVWCTGIAGTIHLLYVARVGGDFLDLYRFLTPLLPAAFAIVTCAASVLFSQLEGRARLAVLGAAACLFAAHGRSQAAMAREATRVAASSRAALHLEPLGWTRLYALRWQGIGKWLARARAVDDSTAVGAAGALPFFSELPNLDLFGLNDAEIARHGRIIGNRPGHQRFATMDYLFAQQPTFVFMSPESTPLRPARLRYDRYWTSRGYLPLEIRVDRELCGCPETFYHQLFVRRDRAASLRGRADSVVGSPGP